MAYSTHQSDGTFFVESDEPRQRMSARDAAKLLARNKQEMIANELSRLACDEYLEDIMQHMRHMEVRVFLATAVERERNDANDCIGRNAARCQPYRHAA